MVKKRLLFLHEDRDLPRLLQKELHRVPSWLVTFEPFGRRARTADQQGYDLVILESRKGWISAVEQIPHQVSAQHPFPVLAIPSSLIRRNPPKFFEMIQVLIGDAERPGRTDGRSRGPGLRENHPSARSRRDGPPDPLLEDFVERKLKEFVKKIKVSQSRNLYTLLLKEIERPLISLTLKETHGNQIQAAMILGMNRNTLRKKIKDLRIPLHRI